MSVNGTSRQSVSRGKKSKASRLSLLCAINLQQQTFGQLAQIWACRCFSLHNRRRQIFHSKFGILKFTFSPFSFTFYSHITAGIYCIYIYMCSYRSAVLDHRVLHLMSLGDATGEEEPKIHLKDDPNKPWTPLHRVKMAKDTTSVWLKWLYNDKHRTKTCFFLSCSWEFHSKRTQTLMKDALA